MNPRAVVVEVGEKLVEIGSSRRPLSKEKLARELTKLALAVCVLGKRCAHRFVRVGARNNRPSGWLRCVECGDRRRVNRRSR